MIENDRLRQWCGQCSEEGDMDWKKWRGHSKLLPDPGSGESIRKLRGRRFRIVLKDWKEWWKKDKGEGWEEIWSDLNQAQRKQLLEILDEKRVPRDLRSRYENIGVLIEDRTHFISAFAFWLYYYKHWRGKIKRWAASLWLRITGRTKMKSTPTGTRWLTVCERRFTVGSWVAIIITLLVTMLGKKVRVGHQLNLDPYMMTGIACGAFILGTWLWYRFVEGVDPEVIYHTNWSRLLYSFPAGLALALICGDIESRVLAVVLAVGSVLVGTLHTERKSIWLKALLIIIPIAFLALFTPIIFVQKLIVGWTILTAAFFMVIRLWWIALNFYDKRQSKSSDTDKGKKELFSALKWFLPQHYNLEQAVLTSILAIALLLISLLWFYSISVPRIISTNEVDGASLSCAVPPWLSSEDKGIIEVDVTNHLKQSQDFNIRLSTADPESYQLGTLSPGQATIMVPPSSQGSETFVITTYPLFTLLKFKGLFRSWNYRLNLVIERKLTKSVCVSVDLPIVSLYLPSLYVHASTFQGWLLRSFWGFAQVLVTLFFASRPERKIKS